MELEATGVKACGFYQVKGGGKNIWELAKLIIEKDGS